MNRADFQLLAEARLKEAKALLDAACNEGAYYLAGYSVECAIKACIAKKTQQYDFPDKKIVSQIFTHNFMFLLRAAGLEGDLNKEIQSNPDFSDNWDVAKAWAEDSRYVPNMPAQRASDLYDAIADARTGVLTWLKRFW
jgi:hypothetical protein